MKSSKLACLGFACASLLIISNVFILRYFTKTVKATIRRDKLGIVSKWSAPPLPEDDDYGILEADKRLLEKKFSEKNEVTPPEDHRNPLGIDFAAGEEEDLEQRVKDIERPFLRKKEKPKVADSTQLVPNIDDEIEKLANEISSSANISCHLKVKFGRDENRDFGHETWRLCFDDPYKIISPCLVYSFGIAYDFSFDDDLAEFGCQVYAFDPSMSLPDHKRDSGVRFFNIGISRRDSHNFRPELNAFNNKTSWVVKSLMTIRRDLKHEKTPIDVLKFDVEGMEWDSIDQAISDNVMSQVRYLLVEWHICPKDFADNEKIDMAREIYGKIFSIGFIKYFSDAWTIDPTNKCRMVLNYFLKPSSFATH